MNNVMQKTINDIVDWIEINLENPLPIDRIAKKSGYSKWHFQRMFKKNTGITLGVYIKNRRLQQAALDLKFTQKSILDISIDYMCESQQAFTREFKKQFGITPAKYRKNHRYNLING